MVEQRKALKFGAMAIAFAVFLRLFGFAYAAARDVLQDSEWLSLAVFLQTGRVVRYPKAQQPIPETSAPVELLPPPPQSQEKPVFAEGDLQYVSLNDDSGYRPDLAPLLTSALSWDLTDGEPAVLILHTHTTEAYTPTQGTQYTPSGDYRTLDEHYNMVSIGEEVARILRSGGVTVLHDKTYHDYPSYNGSYNDARQTIAAYLKIYPSIRLVLDIHRDAIATTGGGQLNTSATVDGQQAAQVMIVIGTDASGNHHPNWRENLALALKLSAQLEWENPGITRPIHLRPERFNMDMTPGSLLVEIGAAGDTHPEALLTAKALARAVLTLAKGTSQ